MSRRIISYGSALIALTLPCVLGESKLQPDDRIVVTSHRPDALLTIGRDGKILWKSENELPHPQQVSALPDGRLFCATIKGAVMLDTKGAIQWSYEVPKGAENATGLYIAPNRYLVSHEGLNELVELNDEGKVILKTSLPPLNHATHGQIRYTGYGDGHYLVPRLNSAVFQEIVPQSGLVVWEIKNMKTVTSALRRSDGGTYTCNHNTLSSYSKQRDLLWKLDFKNDLGLSKEVPPVAMAQLPDGNLIIALYHDHEDVPDLIEIDPAKKSLEHSWSIDGIKNAAGVSYLPASHAFLK